MRPNPGLPEYLTDPARPARRRRAPGGRLTEEAGLRELARLRQTLHAELRKLSSRADYLAGLPPAACCTRQFNQMRITPLEARAIQIAFRVHPRLREHLPAVLTRLRHELRVLKDNAERQPFDCPLLEHGKCLVHDEAKPIGCLAWHPAGSAPSQDAVHFTDTGWQAFEIRDTLNDEVFGADWKARVIPLWLRRVFAEELARAGSGPITAELCATHQRPRKSRPDRNEPRRSRRRKA